MLAIGNCTATNVTAATQPALAQTETTLVSGLIAQALTARLPEDINAAEAALRNAMGRSPTHAVFVARKLMLFDLSLGVELRRRLLLWPIMDAATCQAWLPLREPGEAPDDPRVAARASHVVNVVCAWLDSPGTLAQHLVHVAQPGVMPALSWIWGELMACLLECGVAVEGIDAARRLELRQHMVDAEVLGRHPQLAAWLTPE